MITWAHPDSRPERTTDEKDYGEVGHHEGTMREDKIGLLTNFGAVNSG